MCARHVYANLRHQWKGVQYRNIFWKIAKATNDVHLKRYIKEMQDLDVTALPSLEKKGCNTFVGCISSHMQNVTQWTIIWLKFSMPSLWMLDTYPITHSVNVKGNISFCHEKNCCEKTMGSITRPTNITYNYQKKWRKE